MLTTSLDILRVAYCASTWPQVACPVTVTSLLKGYLESGNDVKMK